MAITYTWAVTGLKKKTEGSNTDAVVQTYWTKTGTDDNDNVGVFSGATPFTSADADPFVAFADLTEAKNSSTNESDNSTDSFNSFFNSELKLLIKTGFNNSPLLATAL